MGRLERQRRSSCRPRGSLEGNFTPQALLEYLKLLATVTGANSAGGDRRVRQQES